VINDKQGFHGSQDDLRKARTFTVSCIIRDDTVLMEIPENIYPYRTEERIPDKWKQSIIVQIFKKKDTLVCNTIEG